MLPCSDARICAVRNERGSSDRDGYWVGLFDAITVTGVSR